MAVRRITTLQGPTLKADDGTTAATIADSTGQITVGATNGWTLPVNKGTNDKYVLQIDTTAAAANWVESLTAPELSGKSGMKINQYEAPYAYTGDTTNNSNSIASMSSTDDLKVGQFISGDGIPANTVIKAISGSTITLKDYTSNLDQNATTTASTVALKIQKTPGEKNGGEVTLTGTNFGSNIADITVAITTSGGAVIANASTLSALSGGTSVKAEWNGSEETYSTDLTSSYTDPIYFKVTKSGLASNILNSSTTLTADPTITATPTQSGGDVSTAPTSTSLGVYGGPPAGGATDSNTKLLLNFDRVGVSTDIEDSSNIGGDGHKIVVSAPNDMKPRIVSSPFGDGKSAMFFDGSDDILSIGDHADFDFTGTWTIEFWMRATSTTNSDGIISFDQGSNGDVSIGFAASSILHFYSHASNNTSQGNWGTISTNTWYHISAVHDGTNLNCYRDGALITSTAWNGTWSTTTDGVKIGQFYASAAEKYFDGYLDEIRIVNGTAVYTSDFTVPTSRLTAIANTKLLIHSDQDATISSESSVKIATSETTNRDETAHANWGSKAMSYGAGSSAADTNTITSTEDCYIGTDKFTLEFWARWSIIAPEWSAMFKLGGTGGLHGSDSSPVANLLVMAGNIAAADYSALSIEWDNNADTPNSYQPLFKGQGSSPHAMTANTWYHIAMECQTGNRSGVGTLKVWVNGDASTDAQCPATIGIAGTKEWHIGAVSGDIYTNDQTFHIDDLRLVVGSNVYGNSSGTINVPTGPLTKVTNTKFLYQTGSHNFVDSATTGTTHVITPTGALHSQGHQGIASAMTWPANGKATGSSGCYFDGSTNMLTVTDTTSVISVNSIWSLDFWIYPQTTATDYGYIIDTRDSADDDGYRLYTTTTGATAGGLSLDLGHGASVTERMSTNLVKDTWTHVAIQSASSSDLKCYFDGVQVATFDPVDARQFGEGGAASWTIGSKYGGAHYFKGYIDSFRVRFANDSFTGAFTPPTRVYGAAGSDNPDVGTITFTTSANDLLFADVGGTTLASKGLTLTDGGGSANTATITGSFSSSVSTDTLSTHLIRVRDETDHTRAIHFGGANGMTITQKSSGKPVLFNARRYVGNDLARSITGYGFKPDLMWFKNRSNATYWSSIFDTIRGGGSPLYSNHISSQGSRSGNAGYITSFNSDGVSISTDTDNSGTNTSGDGIVAWGWKAGGAPSAVSKRMTDGTESDFTDFSGVTNVKQSVNSAGSFSITTYTGNSGAAWIKHGLHATEKPDFYIVKCFSDSVAWAVWHSGFADVDGSLTQSYLQLDTNDDFESGGTTLWNDTGPTTDGKINFGSSGTANTTGRTYVMYCWKAAAGLSAFGTYVGTGSGHTVATGFIVKFVMIKRTDSTGGWFMVDKFRGADAGLQANLTDAEAAANNIGFHSTDGFTLGGSDGSINSNGNKYIYVAFA